MRLSRLLASLAFLILLSGCVSTPQPNIYPDYDDGTRISVSNETVSRWTETPAGDSPLSNSQVFIDSGSDMAKEAALAGLVGGLAPAGSYIVVETSSGQSPSNVSDLGAQFDEQVKALLKQKLNRSYQLMDVEAGQQPDIVLRPSARFSVRSGTQNYGLSMRLTSRYKDNESEKSSTKDYYFAFPEILPLHGENSWVSDGASLFHEKVKEGLAALVEILIDDLSGKYKANMLNEPLKTMELAETADSGAITSVVFLGEHGDDKYVVMPLPKNH
ncbi:MAG: hypothetical protein GKR96_02805 [Gammaproteobacteria bacterium]|nr:hypothetical protein [Gammaproteobacteria bacterium]